MKRAADFLLKYNWLPLVVVIILGFNLINPIFFKNTLTHDVPQGYMASDAYWHAAYAAVVAKEGFLNRAPLFIDPLKLGIPEPEPPFVLYMIGVASRIFNVPYYDGAMFVVFLLLVAAFIALYVFSDSFSPMLPYLTLPATLLMFTFPFLSGISWGFWKMYFGSLLLFISLVFFLLSDRTWPVFIFMGVIFGSFMLTHPYVALFFAASVIFIYLYEIFTDHQKKSISYFLKYAAIAAIGLVLALNTILDLKLTQLSGDLSFNDVLSTGYNIGSATPYANNLGVVWWLSLVGALAAFTILKQKDSVHKRSIAVLGMFFILFLGPVIGFDRIFQFRLVWPLYLALFFGLFFFVLLRSVKMEDSLRVIAAVIIFVAASAYLYLPNAEKLGPADRSYSLTEDSYWEGIQVLSQQEGNLFIVDPTLTQHAIVLNTYKQARFVMQDDVIKNVSIVNYSQVPCGTYPFIRTGFFSHEQNPFAKTQCDTAYSVCKFSYILVHAYVPSQLHQDWLNRQIASLQKMNVTVVWQKEATIIIKNNKVCL